MDNMTEKKAELLQMEEESRELEERDAQAVAVAREKKLAKKKKARRKKILIILIIFSILVAAVAGWFVRKKQQEKTADTTVEIVVEEGQTVIYAQVQEINGNEMTYTVLTEMSQTFGSTENAESGERPQMPEGTEGGERPQMPEGTEGGDITDTAMENIIMTSSGMYQLTDETKTVMIPVGTDVTTKLGTITTFSRLGAEDVVALVMDGEEIVRIYIVG